MLVLHMCRWIVFVAVCLLQVRSQAKHYCHKASRHGSLAQRARLQASAGLNYSFSVFAPLLKHLFELNEVQLGAVATLGFNLGGAS